MSSSRYNFRSRRDTSKSLDRESKTTDKEETPTTRRSRPPTGNLLEEGYLKVLPPPGIEQG